jgi:hypothetical protein
MIDLVTQKVAIRYMRVSGLLEYPEELYQAIIDWVQETWTTTRDFLGKGKTGTKRRKFNVNYNLLQGWKYYEKLRDQYPSQVSQFEPELVVVLKIGAKSGVSQGSCSGTHEIVLGISPYTTVDRLGVTLSHELTHWSQHYLSYVLTRALGKDVQPGLPPRKMLDEGTKQNNHKKDYIERHKLHKLDDREFYPLVRSEVDDLKTKLDTLKTRAETYWSDPEKSEWYADDAIKVRELTPHLKNLLRYYTHIDRSPQGAIPKDLVREYTTLSDDIFSVAAKHNPEKWKRAVRILFDEIEPYLKDSTWVKALGDLSTPVSM